MSIRDNIDAIRGELPRGVALVIVSKTQPASAIMEAYEAGATVFGESRPQEMAAKHEALPKDIRWHMIGHLQTNKVRMIAPFVHTVESVDSQRLLELIDAEAVRCGRVIDVLLEIRIADEQTKSGWRFEELTAYLDGGGWRGFEGVSIRGVMGIATYTDDDGQVKGEFDTLHGYFRQLKERYFGARFDTVSMGMSGDWRLAVECGSNAVRIGSSIFGERI